MPQTVLRPARAAYLRLLRANVVVWVILLVIVVLRSLRDPWYPVVVVIAAGLSFGGVALYFRFARVEYGDGQYLYHSWLGQERRFSASEIGQVITVNAYSSGSMTTTPQFFALRHDGTRALRLHGGYWVIEQLGPLANDLAAHGVPLVSIPERINGAALRARFPRAIGWHEAHPVVFALLITGATVFVVTITVVAAVALSRR